MKNNIAICYYGLMRTNKEVVSTHIENIIDPLKADVFVCTKEFFFAPANLDHIFSKEIEEKVSYEYINSSYGHRLKKAKILPYNPDFFKLIAERKQLPDYIPVLVNEGLENQWEYRTVLWRTLSMFYQIKKVLKLCQEQEMKNGKFYSHIILMRPDLIIKNKIDISDLDLNKVYSTGNHLAPVFGTDRKIGDHLIISNRDNIMQFENIFDSIPKYYREGIKLTNEGAIGWYLLKNKIEFEYNSFLDHDLVR